MYLKIREFCALYFYLHTFSGYINHHFIYQDSVAYKLFPARVADTRYWTVTVVCCISRKEKQHLTIFLKVWMTKNIILLFLLKFMTMGIFTISTIIKGTRQKKCGKFHTRVWLKMIFKHNKKCVENEPFRTPLFY